MGEGQSPPTWPTAGVPSSFSIQSGGTTAAYRRCLRLGSGDDGRFPVSLGACLSVFSMDVEP